MDAVLSSGWRVGLPAALPLLAACSGPQSVLDPAGPGAAAVAVLWWVMFAGASLILLGVCGLALYAVLPRRRGRGLDAGRFLAGGGLVFPLAVLALLLVVSLRAGEALLPHPAPRVVRAEGEARQWFWTFTHYDAAGRAIRTTDELHIPVGVPVDLRLTAADVIHSFWVPRLAGKLDAIPGHENLLRLQADAPGLYEGQCAEFCGLEHTRMRFRVRAHAPADYAAALAGLRLAPTANPVPERGP